MNERKISVIIPIYNTAPYLRRCIESIIKSEYRNIEVICINDGSTDDSRSILADLESIDCRIKVFDQINLGVSAARNRGLEQCTGDLIAFVDSDDMVHPKYFNILYNLMIQTDADITACDYIKFENEEDLTSAAEKKDSGKIRKLSPLEVINIDHMNRYVWGRIYKKDILNGLRFDEEISLGEDTAFNLLAICRKENLNFQYVKRNLYYYYKRSDSAVFNVDHFNVIKVIENVYLKYYDDFGKNSAVILEQAFRSLLLERYVDNIKMVRNHDLEYRRLLKKCIEHLNDLSVMKRLIYYLFAKIPLAYRVFRYIDDPSIILWEKSIKRKSAR